MPDWAVELVRENTTVEERLDPCNLYYWDCIVWWHTRVEGER